MNSEEINRLLPKVEALALAAEAMLNSEAVLRIPESNQKSREVATALLDNINAVRAFIWQPSPGRESPSSEEIEAIRARHELVEMQASLVVPSDYRLAHTDRATLLRLLDAAREELAGHGWQDISTAPKDGTHIQVRHDDGTIEDDVYWSDERYCILGRPQGSRGPGWVSTEAGNLPIDPPFKWRPTPHQTEQKT